MFFGGGKAEEIELTALGALLNSAFDRKLSNFDSKASNMVKELSNAKLQFAGACREFEELEAEPEKANMYIDNISFLKTQKNFYSRALKRIIDDWNITVNDAPNVHSKYATILSNTEEFRNEILKANNNFKQVLYSYSNHLDLFKRYFSLVERHMDSLKSGLNKVDKELSEYMSLSDKINTLTTLKDELDTLNRNIGAFNKDAATGGTETQKEELEISGDLLKKETEMLNLNSEISGLLNRINYITAPLERAARKLDHISPRKTQLHKFIEDPANSINNESDYNNFRMLLEDLKKSVDSGTIDAKNNTKTSEIISDLLKTDIYYMIVSFRALKKKKVDLEEQIRFSKRMLESIKESKSNSTKMIENIEIMKRKVSNTTIKINEIKNSIERLFLESYNKRISVVIS